jgi:hypothetical protein
VATKNYIQTELLGYYPNTTTLNNIEVATGSVSMNSQKIVALLDPTLAQDAATKAYADTKRPLVDDLSEIQSS